MDREIEALKKKARWINDSKCMKKDSDHCQIFRVSICLNFPFVKFLCYTVTISLHTWNVTDVHKINKC